MLYVIEGEGHVLIGDEGLSADAAEFTRKTLEFLPIEFKNVFAVFFLEAVTWE